MEVFGGLMTMFSMVFFFLAVIWFITPFVIFAIKGKVDRTHYLVEQLERRIADLERRLPAPGQVTPAATVETAALPDDGAGCS
jgi:hypothetical protein